jgi:hypothetical protein
MDEMTDEENAARWFSDHTKPQLAKYNQRMADAAPYRGAPRWDRERNAAQREFEASTSDARRVYEMAMHDLMTIGEISEATSYAFDEVAVGQVMQQAAE